MELIVKVNSFLNGIVMGWPGMILLVGTGVYYTIRCGGVQFKWFGYIMKTTIGKIFEKKEAGEGAVTPFQAVCTALAATVGTGNIAGVTGAIALGGPGAVFWMWVSALFGMCTKFAEVTLAIHFRERNDKGDWVGGPMYYIKNGLGKNWAWLGTLFALFGMLAAFGIGNMTHSYLYLRHHQLLHPHQRQRCEPHNRHHSGGVLRAGAAGRPQAHRPGH